MEENHGKQADSSGNEVEAAGRREALVKIGKYGAYVAPAVLAIVLGKSAEASCSCS